ncbi:hypothetical protein Scep_030411 [Stephania cephalantha]|uniref:Uncharacterized protein n=1 Tax=Stephania cephalantha TaxID=152367 RepID=A0AAP0HIL6_9MAGN
MGGSVRAFRAIVGLVSGSVTHDRIDDFSSVVGMTRTKITSSGDNTRAPRATVLAGELRRLLIGNQRSWDGKLMTLTRDTEQRPRMCKGGNYLFTRPRSSGRIFFIGFKRRR